MVETPLAMISSTRRDLVEYIEAARQALAKLGFYILMMEDATAESPTSHDVPYAIQASLALVDRADVYVCIVAHSYGYVPPGRELSLTEMEYNRAEELQIARLVFVVNPDHPWPPKWVAKDGAAHKLDAFKQRLTSNELVDFFSTSQDLAMRLGAASTKWLMKRPADALAASDARRLQNLSAMLAVTFANRIANWFAVRFQALLTAAGDPALRSNDKSRLAEALPVVAAEIERVAPRTDFPGGIYVLDQAGVVLQQFVPLVTSMPDITGYHAGHKDYFTQCHETMGPVVCDSFTSANRKREILVLAVPRVDEHAGFVGILDAVVDVADAPFGDFAAASATGFELDHNTGKALRLMLIDTRGIVLGALEPAMAGRGYQGHPLVALLLQGGAGHQTGYGHRAAVLGTPFQVLAYWEG